MPALIKACMLSLSLDQVNYISKNNMTSDCGRYFAGLTMNGWLVFNQHETLEKTLLDPREDQLINGLWRYVNERTKHKELRHYVNNLLENPINNGKAMPAILFCNNADESTGYAYYNNGLLNRQEQDGYAFLLKSEFVGQVIATHYRDGLAHAMTRPASVITQDDGLVYHLWKKDGVLHRGAEQHDLSSLLVDSGSIEEDQIIDDLSFESSLKMKTSKPALTVFLIKGNKKDTMTEECYLSGKLHADNRPAVKSKNYECWYQFGEKHRDHDAAEISYALTVEGKRLHETPIKYFYLNGVIQDSYKFKVKKSWGQPSDQLSGQTTKQKSKMRM